MELKRAIEIIHTICEESKQCKDCPLFLVGRGRMCIRGDLSSDEILALEQKLTQWEKDQEVHYPTWEQWFRSQHPHGNGKVPCPMNYVYDYIAKDDCPNTLCVDCISSEIPKHAAEILGVKPIERKDD